MNNQHYSSNVVKGIGFILGGVFLLLYTLGLVQKGMSAILIALALIAITYGLIISGLYDYIVRIAKGHNKR